MTITNFPENLSIIFLTFITWSQKKLIAIFSETFYKFLFVPSFST